MAKDVYTAHIDLGSNPVHSVYAGRETPTRHAAQSQFALIYPYVDKQGGVRLGTIWKDTSQPQYAEWLAMGTHEQAPTFHPALSSAISALGERTLPTVLSVLQEAQSPRDAAKARVREFVRQWRLAKSNDQRCIYGIFSDPHAEMAELLVADLDLLAGGE